MVDCVGQVAAFGNLDRVDLADQVGDGDVRCGQLLAVTAVARQPVDRRVVALRFDDGLCSRAQRRERVVVDLAACDNWNGVVEQAGKESGEAGLGLAALAQEADVLAGQDGVLDSRDDRVVVADDAGEERLLRGQTGEQVGAHLLLDRAGLPARSAQLAERGGSGRGGRGACHRLTVARAQKRAASAPLPIARALHTRMCAAGAPPKESVAARAAEIESGQRTTARGAPDQSAWSLATADHRLVSPINSTLCAWFSPGGAPGAHNLAATDRARRAAGQAHVPAAREQTQPGRAPTRSPHRGRHGPPRFAWREPRSP